MAKRSNVSTITTFHHLSPLTTEFLLCTFVLLDNLLVCVCAVVQLRVVLSGSSLKQREILVDIKNDELVTFPVVFQTSQLSAHIIVCNVNSNCCQERDYSERITN